MDTTRLRLIKGNFTRDGVTWEWAVVEGVDGKRLSLRAPAGGSFEAGADGSGWPTSSEVTDQTGWLVTGGAPGGDADERVFRLAAPLSPEEAAVMVLMVKVAMKYETRLSSDDSGVLKSEEMPIERANSMVEELKLLRPEAESVATSGGCGIVVVGPAKR